MKRLFSTNQTEYCCACDASGAMQPRAATPSAAPFTTSHIFILGSSMSRVMKLTGFRSASRLWPSAVVLHQFAAI
jgi:hypothetical protein